MSELRFWKVDFAERFLLDQIQQRIEHCGESENLTVQDVRALISPEEWEVMKGVVEPLREVLRDIALHVEDADQDFDEVVEPKQ